MNGTAFVAIGTIAGATCCRRVGRLLVAQTKGNAIGAANI
jgi:hypothetical protein